MLKQSERAATPFLISKQPYFLPFFYVAASSFSVSRVPSASLWFSLFASLADLSPQLISRHSTFPPTLLRAPIFSRTPFANVRHSQPISSRGPSLVLVLPPSHYRATFDPRVVSVAWPAFFISTPSPSIHIIFLANSLIHSFSSPALSAKGGTSGDV